MGMPSSVDRALYSKQYTLLSLDALPDLLQKVDSDLHRSDHFSVSINAVDNLPQHRPPRWITVKTN